MLTTGLLVFRERSQSTRFLPTSRAVLLESTESWLGLFADDQPVGYVHMQQIPEVRHGVDGRTLILNVDLQLDLFGRDAALQLNGDAWNALLPAEVRARSNRGAPEDRIPTAELGFSVRSGPYDFSFDGEVDDGLLTAEIRNAGEVLPLEVPISDDVLVSAGLGGATSLPVLNVGEQVTIQSFDPVTLRASDTEVRCVAREVIEVDGVTHRSRVLEVESLGLTTKAWIDDSGQVLKARTPIGLELRRISADQLAQTRFGGDAGALLGLSAIHPTGVTPNRGVTHMQFRVTAGPSDLPISPLQFETGGLWTRTTNSEPSSPERGAPHPAQPAGQETPELWLAADAFVQSDHPRMQEQSRAIVDGLSDPKARALAIHDWVFEEIAKEPALGIPSALEILEHRRGDCNEHTVLYAALARAAGLPTRIAIGVVWSEDLGGFYYHAWPEVWFEDRGGWSWIDPTLGQPSADATHIKLLDGGIETWPRLLPWLGQLELDIEDVAP